VPSSGAPSGLRLADHIPQNECLVVTDPAILNTAALRLECAHHAVAAVDAGDDSYDRSPTVFRVRVLMLSSSRASQLSIWLRM
jgi:hypothetical protein